MSSARRPFVPTPRRAQGLASLLAGLAVVVAVGAVAPPRRAAAADAPKQPWELEVERETADQTALLEAARRRKGLDAVVQRYESRVGRDPSVLNRYLLGRAQYWNGDPAAARRQMEMVLRENPGFYFARVRLAILLSEAKDFAGAEREATAVLAVRPDQVEAREVLTAVALERKDWDRALKLLNDRLDREPNDLRVRYLLMNVHLQRKDVASALKEARTLRTREPDNRQYRLAYAVCLAEKGDLDAAIGELESLARAQPGDLDVLDRLRACYAKKKDWDRLRTTLERMVPHLPEDAKKDVLGMIEELKKGPPVARTGPSATTADGRVDWNQVFRAAKGPDPAIRARALRAVYEGTQMELLARIDGELLRRLHPEVEPDPECRAWVVRIHGTISPPEIPLLQIALYDDVPKVRMLAAEVLGDLGSPLGLVYLLPLVEVESTDVFEFQTIRDALARITGFVDLPAGTSAVSTAAEVVASREAWRRWSYSTGARDLKLKAVDALLAVGKREPTPERYLYRFVLDPDFEVMSSAYRAMRDVVARGGVTDVEKRVFPAFPSVSDADVTRAGMRALQDRTAAWWGRWVAERRAGLPPRSK